MTYKTGKKARKAALLLPLTDRLLQKHRQYRFEFTVSAA